MNTTTGNNQDFEWEMRNEFLVLRITARRATVDMAPDLKNRLFSEIEKGNIHIIIDFSYVEFVDSSLIGALVAGLKQVSLKEGEIKISGLHPHVRITFELTRLDHLFKIYQTIEQAMREA